jgi:GTP pyrophosphokinase
MTSPTDEELIRRAYEAAKKAHKGQKRASGEPYINHCLAVGTIMAELGAPTPTIVAGLLHDTVEDTDFTLDDLDREFGSEVAQLVDGVTKLTQLPRVSRSNRGERPERRELANETLRKTFLAMGDDVRVVVIKLADRLHNMRTLSHLSAKQRERIALETIEIFAPLASRLGIWQIKWELEDLAFRYVYPDEYKMLADQVAIHRGEREEDMKAIRENVDRLLRESEIEAEVRARPKHLYSIYRKMERKDVPFEEVYDIRGVRVLLESESDCYTALGVIHKRWKPVPGTFDDYIATPKDNFYQSLHTAVIFDDGRTVEVQIRTPEMEENAEFGIAAHWRYKEGRIRDDGFERRVNWLRNLMEWRQDVTDAGDFMDAMKSDVFEDRVFVFTPQGDVIDLPVESTPIDFAYHIHTEIGHRCRGARVNGKLVSLDTNLKTGDSVEILTTKRGGPSRDWLNPSLEMVRSQRARTKIRQWFRKQDRKQNISHGRQLVDREVRRLGIQEFDIDRLAEEMKYSSGDELLAAVGVGDINLGKIVNRAVEREDVVIEPIQRPIRPKESVEVSVLGLTGLLTNLGRCCNPVPGDPIIGYVTRGRGATIHRQDCPNVLRIKDKERLVSVSWGKAKDTYPVSVQIRAYDRDGLMRDVSTLVTNEGISMSSIHVSTEESLAIFELVMGITDLSQLSRVLNRLEALPNVLEARRVQAG